jgi:hypothetical protein
MNNANKIFLESMDWLKENYSVFRFITERDIVWTLQKKISDIINREHLTLKVFNDYPMIKAHRRSLSADLVVLNELSEVEVAVEFKYEPSHKRNEYTEGKFPVTDRKGILNDITRIKEFTDSGKAKIGHAIFVDEGSHFYKKIVPIENQGEWFKWGHYNSDLLNISVLWTTNNQVV